MRSVTIVQESLSQFIGSLGEETGYTLFPRKAVSIVTLAIEIGGYSFLFTLMNLELVDIYHSIDHEKRPIPRQRYFLSNN
jgi:hypothetical protein